jgi:hypothetical protein
MSYIIRDNACRATRHAPFPTIAAAVSAARRVAKRAGSAEVVWINDNRQPKLSIAFLTHSDADGVSVTYTEAGADLLAAERAEAPHITP